VDPYRSDGAPPKGEPAAPPPDDEWMLPALPLVIALLRLVTWVIEPAPRADSPSIAIAVVVICLFALGAQAWRTYRRRGEDRERRDDRDAS
jgi:hypothetical protein